MFAKRLISRFVFTSTVLIALFFSSLGTTPVYAGSMTVNTNLDELTTNGKCSLREAIINANDDGASYPDCATGFGIDTITFAGNYTITLTLGDQLPMVTSAIIINGKGAGKTIIQASVCNPVTLPGECTPATARVFQVSDGNGNLTLDSLTVRHGYAQFSSGGGIYNLGTLTVTNSIISGNRAVQYNGAGIYNGNTMTVTNSTISGNRAGFNGGGIYNSSGSTLTVTNNTLSGNTAAYEGGGIYNNDDGNVTMTHSTISGNKAEFYGGGIVNYGANSEMAIQSSTIAGNQSNGGAGGIHNTGTLSIANSTLSGNSASQGGGIYNSAGAGNGLTVTNSTLSSNSANLNGGGIYATGAIGTTWPLIYNSSIVFNVVNAGSSTSAGGIEGNLNVFNSIVAGNTRTASSTYRDCSGFVYLSGRNLFSDTTNCTINDFGGGGWGYLTSLNDLGPLQNNGGPTWTHALLPGSNAINTGNNSICADAPINNLDQRGVKRPQGSHCDVGAFEYNELLSNGRFEHFTGKIPDGWTPTKFTSNDGMATKFKEGAFSIKLVGNGKAKKLFQTLILSGSQGDPFTFSYWVKGNNLPTTNLCQGQVKFYDGLTPVGTRTLKCPSGTFNWKFKTLDITAPANYTRVDIIFTFSKTSGTVYFDAASLVRR